MKTMNKSNIKQHEKEQTQVAHNYNLRRKKITLAK